jgi:hypothetical protein
LSLGLGISFSLFAESSVRDSIKSEAPYWQGPFFWQTKADIQERMKAQRYIPVSVLKDEDHWQIKGAGRVKAEAHFVYDYARDFDHLRDYPKTFAKVDWSLEKQELVLVPSFFARTLSVKLKISYSEDSKAEVKRIHFEILEGPFTGALGALLIYEISRQECEVGLVSVYNGKIVNFGGHLFSVMMEGALHGLASGMRDSVETAFLDRRKE